MAKDDGKNATTDVSAATGAGNVSTVPKTSTPPKAATTPKAAAATTKNSTVDKEAASSSKDASTAKDSAPKKVAAGGVTKKKIPSEANMTECLVYFKEVIDANKVVGKIPKEKLVSEFSEDEKKAFDLIYPFAKDTQLDDKPKKERIELHKKLCSQSKDYSGPKEFIDKITAL